MSGSIYPSPVDKLLTYGDCSEMETIPNYIQELGFSADHIPDLIRLATDKELNGGDVDTIEAWGPVHAVRVLNQLGAEAAIQPLVNLFHELDDDWMPNELFEFYSNIGAAAIPTLEAYLQDSSHDAYNLADAATSLTKIAEKHPDLRDKCVAVLTQRLADFTNNDKELNAFFIGELLDLKAVESAPVMERAFEANRVSTVIVGDWDMVQVELGLKTPEEVPQTKFRLEDIISYYKQELPPLPRGFAPPVSDKHKKKKKKK
ncbi:hypothetical protein NOS3756_22160 [Nostoc sp. NIES-3756]|uniref:hypothetical protein n=1 Tax=Nostoc sp. NIES-3756 TaxID=1751286 RepID=UPI00071F72C0|nr:hypothetical protein [Nostoc sp. NIES-3756]BAT53257.1 hypothetical protein NOS3756_22160 [Nostoc sp. NIES-3756]